MGNAATAPGAHQPTAARSADAVLMPLLAGGLLAAPDAEFVRLGTKFREELAPRDLWETLQAELVLLALAMLRRAVVALLGAPDDLKAFRAQKQAHATLSGALREYTKLRKRKLESEPAPASVVAAPTTEPAVADRARTAAPTPARVAAGPEPRPAARVVATASPLVDPIATPRHAGHRHAHLDRLLGGPGRDPAIVDVRATPPVAIAV